MDGEVKKFFVDPPLGFILPITLYLVGLFFDKLSWFILGFYIWTLWEYIFHRFIFHGVLKTHHRLHHLNPDKYISIPLYIYVLGTGLFIILLPLGIVSGMLFGYCLYEIIHRLDIPWHLQHHYNSKENFGVSTDLWDWIFRTGSK